MSGALGVCHAVSVAGLRPSPLAVASGGARVPRLGFEGRVADGQGLEFFGVNPFKVTYAFLWRVHLVHIVSA